MNNNLKVLALKYRPQTFDDLIGQEVVAETITNSIKADKIPNAYSVSYTHLTLPTTSPV